MVYLSIPDTYDHLDMETSGGIEKNNHVQLKQKTTRSQESTVVCS